jgi:alanine-glyoxylate transaminase/serine-glyoxylate transaminase/serine-pyruvate transaminase
LLFALRKALDILFTEGLDAAARRHALLAEATRQAVTRWAEGQVLAFNVIKPEERANSVTCVLMQGQDPRALLDYCRFKCGVIPGQGIGDLSGRAFRIAHMGHVNAPMVIGALGAIEMGLTAVGIPHGRGGVQAAVEYLAREVPL